MTLEAPPTAQFGIPSWSYRVIKARKQHVCANCGGAIPIGVYYQRDVNRSAPEKGDGFLENVHFHLDCEAPWWQPEDVHRLRSLGLLPRRVPPADQVDPEVAGLPFSVTVHDEQLGTLTWQLPEALASRIWHAPDTRLRQGTQVELTTALQLVLNSLLRASGYRKGSRQLSNLLNELQSLLREPPEV